MIYLHALLSEVAQNILRVTERSFHCFEEFNQYDWGFLLQKYMRLERRNVFSNGKGWVIILEEYKRRLLDLLSRNFDGGFSYLDSLRWRYKGFVLGSLDVSCFTSI